MDDKIQKAIDVVARLRAPDGCPWDREQTRESIKDGIIEEGYELIDAINQKDDYKIKDELGDVFMQVLMQAQMAKEEGLFDLEDVAEHLSDKLIRRHPHVFGNLSVDNTDQIIDNWENIKKNEKCYTDRKSAIDGIPGSFTSLMRAYKMSKKAVKAGFHWNETEEALKKVEEEVKELREAVENNSDANKLEEELGDVLYAVCALSGYLKIQPEIALKEATDKFQKRFQLMEDRINAEGKVMKNMTLDELMLYWKEVKEFY